MRLRIVTRPQNKNENNKNNETNKQNEPSETDEIDDDCESDDEGRLLNYKIEFYHEDNILISPK